MIITLLSAIAFGAVGTARAQSSVFTPMLSAGTNTDTIVCRVSNTDTIGQFVTVQFRSGYSGVTSGTSVIPIPTGETREISGLGNAEVYCEAIANTATIANKLVVGLYTVDTFNKYAGALSGARVLTGSGSVQRTPSIEAGSTGAVGCHVVNVGSTSQTVTATLLDDAGATLATQTSTIASMAGFHVTTGLGPLTARCEVTAASNAAAKDLRVSSFEAIGGIFYNSYGPVAGNLRP